MTKQNYKSIMVSKETKVEFDLLRAVLQLSQDEVVALLIKNFKSKENGK